METCTHCGRALSLVPADDIEHARESVGFGAANDRMRRFCSTRCKALWMDVDPVLERTRQATLAAFDTGSLKTHNPDAVAWSVD